MQYAHGGDIYTYKNLLDFSINVNPLGPADAVVEAAARSLQRIGEYPDSRSRELRNALAEKKGLEAERFVIGNGAADLLFSLVLAEKPQKAMIVIPAFSEYEQALKTVGCEILYHEVKKENNFRLGTDLTEKITSELDFLFLCSPSNPAGQAVEKEFLIKIAEKCEKERVRLVLDECFVQFLTSGKRHPCSWRPAGSGICSYCRLLQKSMQFRESVLGTGSVLIKHCWNGWRRYVSRGAYQLRHRLRDFQH